MNFTALPFPVGPVHFVGIGGIGMSGIAEVMLNLGYKVQGSDIKANPNVERLRKAGAKVAIGHAEENVEGAGAIVVSSAIKPDNPELVAARAAKIPVVRRAEMLAELMRLKYSVAVGGTHGKTTTTSLTAVLLDAAGVDPTVINGGIISAYQSNAKVGLGDWMAVEADESDGSFLKLRSTVAIVTNIDPEHMEHYGDFDTLRDAFYQFVENLPFYGFAVLCTDHPEVQSLASRVDNRRVITYGFNPQADVRAHNLRAEPSGTTFDITFRLRGQAEEIWKDVFLPMVGEFNVLNTLAALSTSRELGLTEDKAKGALAEFGGVKRRFTQAGSWKGATIIDDYGHHPVEIAAVLKAARQASTGKVLAIVQPHRYSRLADLFEDFSTCFNDADTVMVADVFAAGEAPLEGYDRDHLVESLISHGHREAIGVTRNQVAAEVKARAGEGDIVIFLGAGDITQWAYALQGELEALD
ncbi:MAG: UDP-N-acetylmuramate--L-alanine ligase [Alphaproteobacteria bacterium]|nr:UDP-N-acetylmuramate--L-alanine ligase [Alphaproteobacteria bacterium]